MPAPHTKFPTGPRDLGFGDVETAGGKLYRHNIAASQVVPEDYYMRIGIRGDDAWRPSVVTAWCQRFTSGAIVPLGYDEELDVVLSTDPSEGRISLPLRTITPGRIRTEITRVLLVTGTNIRDSATDSPVHVTITRGDGSVVVDHTIPDTSQPDFEGAEGNVYFLPVLQPFTRSQLTGESIVLSVQGDDACCRSSWRCSGWTRNPATRAGWSPSSTSTRGPSAR
jgi:hypothetical protein